MEKVRLTHEAHALWLSGGITEIGITEDIEEPVRPEKPLLCDTREMPSHKILGVPLPLYLVHSIAHVEINAIEVAWSLVLMGAAHTQNLPREFFSDWVTVANDEARHFAWLDARLREMGSFYGALPAHKGLWTAAKNTRHDIKARLAVVPLVSEARGLDAGPRLTSKLISAGDKKSAQVVGKICDEEVSHVQLGLKWFLHLCQKEGVTDPKEQFQHYVRTYIQSPLPAPFNAKARQQAGLEEDWYVPLSDLAIKRQTPAPSSTS